MARRKTRSRRGVSRTTARTAPRQRRDGKVDVFCPQCSAQFRLAEDALDRKIQCTECHRTFFAKTSVGRPRRKQDYTRVYVGFGALAVFMIASFAILSSRGAPPPREVSRAPEQSTIDRNTHPRAVQLKEWARRVASGDKFGIVQATDMAAMLPFFGLPAADYGNATSAEKDALDASILEAFKTHEKARYLRDLVISSASLESMADAQAETGAGILYFSAPEGSKRYLWNRQCQIRVRFRAVGASIRVTGWEVIKPPLERDLAGGGAHHEKIAAPKAAKSPDGRDVTESEPCALDHDASVPPEMRRRIDELVDAVLASARPDTPGGLFVRTVEEMKTIGDRGREVVPRLLNKMYELYADPVAHNAELTQLCAAAADITGCRFAYDPRDSGDANRDKAARQSTIRQWFAFWYSGFQREWNIEKEESLEVEKPSAQGPSGTPQPRK